MTYFIFRPWVKSISGNVGIMFALIALPMFTVFGFAIDASRQVSAKKHAQHAADAAALAGARTFRSSFDETEAITRASETFDANVSTAYGDVDCTISSLTASAIDLTVSVEASCDIPTLFGIGVSGESEVSTTVVSKAIAWHTIADVAMMFDVSGSMDATELGHLKTAGKRAAQIIIGTQPGVRGRVSVVPFAGGVNAGDFGNLASNRASDTDSEADDYFTGPQIKRVCVTERTGPEKYTDASPVAGQYVGPPTTPLDVAGNPIYINPSRYGCPNSPLHPLESELATVEAAIDALQRSPTSVGSNTAGHMGILWSWYTLSPNWSSVWTAAGYGGNARHDPHPYGDPGIAKIAILMTDGLFQHGFNDGFGNSDDVTETTQVVAAAEAICAEMLASGVTIYAIGYAVTSPAETMQTNCAGDPNRVFTTDDASELPDIYHKIAGQYLGVGLIE